MTTEQEFLSVEVCILRQSRS